MDKKEINSKVAIKSLINSFVCYGILCIFICLFILSIATYFLKGFSGTAAKGLYVTLPLIAVIIIYFVIHCICIISIVLFLSLLYLNLQYQVKSIELAELKYKEVFSAEHINVLKSEMVNTYNESKTNLIISTVILEIGIATSFLSLIPYQRKMILKYNEF